MRIKLREKIIKSANKILPPVLKGYLRGIRYPFELEVHIAEHCNLNCVSCMHYSSIAEPEFPDLKEIEKNLLILSKSIKYFGTIRILGGEPLLNPEITKYLYLFRNSLGNVRIELLTNGILLLNEKVIKDNFWEACRKNNIIIAITKYPVNIDYEKIKTLGLRHNCKIEIFGDRTGETEFCAYRLIDNSYKHNLRKYYKCLNRRCLQLVDNKIYPCSVSAYVRHINKKFDKNFTHKKNDFIEIENLSLYKLIKFLTTNKPFCSHCTPRSEGFSWSKSEFKKSEWLK